jgi:hypothetical protein
MFWRKRNRDQEPAASHPAFGSGVGDECDAYLAGRLAFYLRELGRPVPPVAWLNRVVHATPAELVILANEADDADQPMAWRRTVGYLARTLLERSRETGRRIDRLQQELLVPLELELIGDVAAAQLDSAEVVRLTLARLYELPELSA